ncbi:MAG: SHOCT domain-containing protein [Sphingomonadales bacterium]|nr:SHOCT domain-containing protein [Sphingomonadales bacterium]
MTNHLDAIERLHRLKEAGALSEAEFAEQKAKLLAHADAPPIAAPSPQPVEPVYTPLPEYESGPKAGRNLVPYIGWGAGALAVALGLGWMLSGDGAPAPQPLASASEADAAVATEAFAKLRDLPEAEQLRLASLAALGFTGTRKSKDGEQVVITKPLRVLNLPFATVLLTSTERPDDCHGCAGFVGVYYLKEQNGAFKVTGKWPEAVSGWAWGMVPDWKISTAYTSNPAIVAEGAFTAQGYTCTGMNIVELTPKGPVESDVIHLSMNNGGAVDPETGLTMGGDPARDVTGKIVNVRKGKSLQVQISGDENFTESYEMKGGKFVRTSGETKLGC